jgi:hypothetical protein
MIGSFPRRPSACFSCSIAVRGRAAILEISEWGSRGHSGNYVVDPVLRLDKGVTESEGDGDLLVALAIGEAAAPFLPAAHSRAGLVRPPHRAAGATWQWMRSRLPSEVSPPFGYASVLSDRQKLTNLAMECMTGVTFTMTGGGWPVKAAGHLADRGPRQRSQYIYMI